MAGLSTDNFDDVDLSHLKGGPAASVQGLPGDNFDDVDLSHLKPSPVANDVTPVTLAGYQAAKDQTQINAARAGEWGPVNEFGDAATLGLGPKAKALGSAIGQGLRNGVHSLKELGNYYDLAHEHYLQSQQAWEQLHPDQSLIAQTAGTAVPQTEAMLLTGGALGAVGKAGLPYVSPTARALVGEAGLGQSGFTGTAKRYGSNLLNAGVTGGVAGAVATPVTGGNVVDNTVQGAETGLAIGSVTPVIAAATNQFMGPITAKTAVLADQYGDALRTRGGQLQDAGSLGASLDRGLNGGYSGGQKTALQTELAKQIGLDTTGPLTSEDIAAAKTRIGQERDDALGALSIRPDSQLHADLKALAQRAMDTSPQDSNYNRQWQLLRNITQRLYAPGGMTGEDYGKLVGYKGDLAKVINYERDPNFSAFAKDIKSALESGLQRGAAPIETGVARVAEPTSVAGQPINSAPVYGTGKAPSTAVVPAGEPYGPDPYGRVEPQLALPNIPAGPIHGPNMPLPAELPSGAEHTVAMPPSPSQLGPQGFQTQPARDLEIRNPNASALVTTRPQGGSLATHYAGMPEELPQENRVVSGDPTAFARFKKAQQQYANAKSLEQITKPGFYGVEPSELGRGGANAPTNMNTPLGPLSQYAQATMKGDNSLSTVQKALRWGPRALIGGGVGELALSGLGYPVGENFGTLAAAAAGVGGAKEAAAAALRSKAYRNLLVDSALRRYQPGTYLQDLPINIAAPTRNMLLAQPDKPKEN